jgi:hypothetical protein
MGISPSNQEPRKPGPTTTAAQTGAAAAARVVARMAPPSYPSGEDALRDKERNQRLRELRDEVQDLRGVLQGARTGETTLADVADYVDKARDDIGSLLKVIPGADPVRRVSNTWDQIQLATLIRDPRATLDAQAQLRQLTLLDDLCKRLVFQVGLITIPERVNEWLRLARPGYYFPFHLVFEDELPDFEERVKLLNYLAWAPKVLEGGLVNVETGFIYRYSQDPLQRLATLAGVVLAFFAAALLVVGACYVPVQDWPLRPENLGPMLIGWAAVLMGVIVHIGVATAKRSQSQDGRPPIIATEDTLLWINAKFGYIMLKMLLALIGFFALAFTAGAQKVTPLSMFLVGYSLDSVVEVFGVSLDQRAAAQVASVKRQLGTENTNQ